MEDESYLYVNEGGFTPGMYRGSRKAAGSDTLQDADERPLKVPSVEELIESDDDTTFSFGL